MHEIPVDGAFLRSHAACKLISKNLRQARRRRHQCRGSRRARSRGTRWRQVSHAQRRGEVEPGGTTSGRDAGVHRNVEAPLLGRCERTWSLGPGGRDDRLQEVRSFGSALNQHANEQDVGAPSQRRRRREGREGASSGQRRLPWSNLAALRSSPIGCCEPKPTLRGGEARMHRPFLLAPPLSDRLRCWARARPG